MFQELPGEIDYQATGNGVIVCKDGFRATSADATTFERLAAGVGVAPRNRSGQFQLVL